MKRFGSCPPAIILVLVASRMRAATAETTQAANALSPIVVSLVPQETIVPGDKTKPADWVGYGAKVLRLEAAS